MICYYLNDDKNLTIHHTADEDPMCGIDYCDRCGDCLECYGDDPCVNDNAEHLWVKYHDEWNEP